MPAGQGLQAFQLLRDIEIRSQQRALGLPQKAEVRRTWSGIGFRLGEHRMVSPTSEIVEILKYPPLTRVPSALFWVKGIANIRGTLLPVVDLKGFIEGEQHKLDRRSRVLIIRQGGFSCGLLVDEILGLRHFFEEERTKQLPKVSTNLLPYLNGAFKQGDVTWGIFDMHSLAKSPQFMEVASRG